jgi:GMP reductase
MNNSQVEYNFKDILLQPKFSPLESRSEASTNVIIGSRTFKLPIIPANMKTVIDKDLAIWFAENDYFYVMHRFGINQLEFCRDMKERDLPISISVGVNEDSYESLEEIKDSSIVPDYITVDIAHGACDKMKRMMAYINTNFKESFLIVGNVCTRETTRLLCHWGANAVKIGIGPGSVCTTKLKTGFSRPQFSAILACSEVCDDMDVVAIGDGGIEHNGDIAKALVAGADLVMAGGIFAGHEESPGRTIVENGVHYKEFFGSASEHNKGEKKNVEGRRILIPLKGSIEDTLTEIHQDLQSSISYAGGTNLLAFTTVNWVAIH